MRKFLYICIYSYKEHSSTVLLLFNRVLLLHINSYVNLLIGREIYTAQLSQPLPSHFHTYILIVCALLPALSLPTQYRATTSMMYVRSTQYTRSRRMCILYSKQPLYFPCTLWCGAVHSNLSVDDSKSVYSELLRWINVILVCTVKSQRRCSWETAKIKTAYTHAYNRRYIPTKCTADGDEIE